MARPYRPTQRPTRRAAAAMLCGAAGSALVLSVLWPQLGDLGNILVVGTVARALLLGLFLSWVAARTVFANSRAAAGLAIAATLCAIVGGHYQEYRADRVSRIEKAEDQRLRSLSFARIEAEANQEYSDTVSTLTFANYLRGYFGFGGVQARDDASSKGGPRFGVGLYLVEILLALLAATYFPQGRASEPACAQCHRWYRFAEAKRAAHGVSKGFIKAMKANATAVAMALLQPPDTEEYVALSLARCPGACSAPALLRVADFSRAGSGAELTSRHRADLVLSQRETTALQEWS
tara:strand:- start:3960 stop:4838 length:879 start_codon:yes stop_codon:yes gene_type:complete